MLFFNLKNQVFSISLCCQDILCPENTKPFVKNYLNLQDVISKCRCCHRHIAARNHRVTNVQLKIKRLNREKDDEFISFILKPCDFKFGMHEVKTLFFFLDPQIMYISLTFIFFSDSIVFCLGQSQTPFLYMVSYSSDPKRVQSLSVVAVQWNSRCAPTVFSQKRKYINHLVQNHWANFILTCNKPSLGAGNSICYK